MPRATPTRSRRTKALTVTILLSALTFSPTLLVAYTSLAHGTTVAPGALPSWNPAVHCTAILATIEGVIGNQANANGGATYGGGGFLPGIPDKRSTSPPCTVNGNATFVEIHGVHIPTYIIEDCASYPNGSFCDTTFNAVDPKCTSSDVYLCRIHMEIDQAWKSAGVAPQNPPTTTQLFDVQGFVYWDTGRDVYQWHSYSGWEIHALTAWRLSGNNSPLSTSFTYSPSSPSTGTQVSFTATASGGTQPYSFSWNYGDGSTGTGSSATHAYTTSGSYTVVLTVKDSSSPQQTAASQQTVSVTSPPPPSLTASFTYSPSSPAAGQQVTFMGSASGGTPPYSFSWNFGDGSTGAGSSVGHTYGTAGTFTVILTVKDSGAPQQTINSQQSITVANPPPRAIAASFTYSPANPNVGQTVSFTGSASGGTQPYSYSWAFGDSGTASGSSVTHSYQAAGSYNVVLTVTDAAGQIASSAQTVTVSNPVPTKLTASFSYTPASPSVGQQVTFTASASGGTAPYAFSWNFGDGSTNSGSTVTHAYSSADTFSVVSVVSDSGSPQQTATSQKSVTVTSPPPSLTASFTFTPSTPQVGQQISFVSSASGGTTPYAFSWTFGDGTSGTGSTMTHTYTSAGTYTVTLTTTDSGSPQQTVTSQRFITVTSPPPPPLGASFTFRPSSPTVGQAVSFTGSATGGVSPYSYAWSFGDRGTGSGNLVSHTFQSSGTYAVVLTITDSSGQTTTSSQTITVSSPLSASISHSPSNPSVLAPVTFTGSASGGTAPYTYSWDFGDGTTDSGASVSHSYLLPGTYTVTLTVTDASGQTATSTVTITVSLPLP